MQHNYPIEELKSNPNYNTASKILHSILKREIPDEKTLTGIFGNLTPRIIYHLEKHFDDFPMKEINIRDHTVCPFVITKARKKLEQNSEFAKLQSLILNNKLPKTRDISPIYGEYSETVKTIIGLYNKHGLKRKCIVPAAAHLSRVGGLVHTLGFDDPGSSKFCTVAFLHDSIEDLITYEKRLPADHYGLKGLESFIDEYIPEELQAHVRLLTNQYALILNYLNYLLTLSDTKTNKKNLLKAIESLGSWEWSLNENVNKLSVLLNSGELEEPALKNANWLCYKYLYVKEMADDALEMSDFRTFEIKAIDLSDNVHSSAALSMKEKIKNIIKLGIWANQGYRLQTSWNPVNNFVQELFEVALVYSEYLVIKDFLQPVSKQDFFVSALLKIEELKTIFYTG